MIRTNSWARTIATAILLAAATFVAAAADPPASAPAPEAVDAAIDRAIALDPAQLVAKIGEYKKQLAELEKVSAEKKQQADELDKQAAADAARLETIKERVTALGMALDEIAGETKTSDAGAAPEMTMAAAPAPAPTAAPAAEMVVDIKPSVTYQDHILPILKVTCVKCHNQDKQRGGLAMDNYATLMQGGSSGAVIARATPTAAACSGSPAASRSRRCRRAARPRRGGIGQD